MSWGRAGPRACASKYLSVESIATTASAAAPFWVEGPVPVIAEEPLPMLIRILSLLLESLFFVLIAAALLRAWMNWLRINMRVQPGSFVMALTDWLVKPLRRGMPAKWMQSRIDWASVVAAVVLALLYASLWTLLLTLLSGSLASSADLAPIALSGAIGFAVKTLARVVLQMLFFMVLGFVILSWVQPGSPIFHLLNRLTEPMLAPLRRVVPTIGGVDLSALVLMLILQICLMLVG